MNDVLLGILLDGGLHGVLSAQVCEFEGLVKQKTSAFADNQLRSLLFSIPRRQSHIQSSGVWCLPAGNRASDSPVEQRPLYLHPSSK